MNCPQPNAPSVLIVEDEALIRLGLVSGLEAAGHRVCEAGTADEAIYILQSGIPLSAVVTDLRMPGRLDGIGLVEWLRKHRPELPIIVATGCKGDMEKSDAKDGVSAVIVKPYQPTDIIALINRFTAARPASDLHPQISPSGSVG